MLKSLLAVALLSLLLIAAPARAQTDAAAAEWQAVISGQVDAFHVADAAAALGFAAEGFKKNFADPRDFLLAVVTSGYGPIVESTSHNFGPYELVDPDMVLQAVTFVGPDQAVYEAIYQLKREAEGWRIASVQLMKTTAIGA
jgi:hypothetical protein